MICMINKFSLYLSLFLLIGCNAVGSAFTYTEAANFLKGYATSFPEDKISLEQFNDFDTSFANIKIGRGPSSLVVLAYASPGNHEWISSDGVQVFTNKGYIFKTMGLSSDVTLEAIDYLDRNLQNTSFTSTATFYNPDLFLTSVENYIQKSDKKIVLKRPNGTINATLYNHDFYVPNIKWRGNNKFYVNDEGLIIRTEQDLHPKISKFKIDFFYKF
ncbi:MAG: hypothetical protein CMD68_02175 [Gammaproteobacteria bacterium]|nr:hypothetical protein [Gammaproteobacteria bacterium]